MSLKNNARLVYSTEDSGKCPVCGWPQRNCQCSTRRAASEPIPTRVVAKLRIEKKGRGGKTVTVVYDLPQNDQFLKELSQDLKKACGTGGGVQQCLNSCSWGSCLCDPDKKPLNTCGACKTQTIECDQNTGVWKVGACTNVGR